MSAEGKAEIITRVNQSGLPRSRALAQLRLPRSTFYRWLKRLSVDFGEIGHRIRSKPATFSGKSATPWCPEDGGAAPSLSQFSST